MIMKTKNYISNNPQNAEFYFYMYRIACNIMQYCKYSIIFSIIIVANDIR